MRTPRFLATLSLVIVGPALLCAATQDRTPVNKPCPNRMATTTAPPNLTCTQNTTTCDITNAACGRTCTYTPPATNCTAVAVDACCRTSLDWPYTQDFNCDASGQCVGGAKITFGAGVTVYRTSECTEQGTCQSLSDHPDNR